MIAEVKPELNDLVLAKWQNMLDFVANLFGVEVSRITRVQNHSIETILSNKSSKESVVKKQKLGEGSFCDIVINNREPLAIENVINDEKWAKSHGGEKVAYLGVPISWPDEEIFGTLVIEDIKEHAFTSRYHDIMASFEEIMNTDLALLMESESFDKRSTFHHMSVHHIKSAVIIYDEDGVIKSFNEVAEHITNYTKEEVIGNNVSGLKATLGLGQQLMTGKLYEIECKKGHKKIILVDMTTMEGPGGGVLTVLSFTDQSHYLELQTKQIVETSIDDVTGVYNFSGISDLLNNEAKRASRYKHPLSIVVVRIDGYHILDEAHGGGKADIVLQTLAIILKNETRDVDLIGRLSDDIFIVILPNTAQKAAGLVAKRIAKAADNYSDDETPFTVSVATRFIERYEEVDWHEEAVAMLLDEGRSE